MNCPNCGEPASPADTFCGSCGRSLASSPGGVVLDREMEQPVPTSAGQIPNVSQFPPPAGQTVSISQFQPPVVQDDPGQIPFRLAYDETVLKKYEAIVVRTPIFKRKRGQGTLYVTDARVVFYARIEPRGTMRASRLMQQTKLEDISGLTAFVTRQISLGLLLFTAFFALATLGTLVTGAVPIAVIFLILTVICVIFLVVDARNRGKTGVIITSRENGNSPISFGFGGRQGIADSLVRALLSPILFFFPSYSAFHVLTGDPAGDADQLVHELGALILDLQTRGATAYDHWGVTGAADQARAIGIP
jgi:hypothetical protein